MNVVVPHPLEDVLSRRQLSSALLPCGYSGSMVAMPVVIA